MKKLLLTSLLAFSISIGLAQRNGPPTQFPGEQSGPPFEQVPGDGDGPPWTREPAGIPIDGGLSILMASGIAFGIYKFRKRNLTDHSS
ncbi:hypothetical protein WJR50_29305 [Catalinimonas sp. 4WD22]|uniref:PID-CTERM protein-sorting domain-containing protein n=1 Tax=Catalinimonas locisalis TaxID=3133978 RepID=UPI003101A674